MIKIYNTLSRKKEKVDLSKKVGIYVCGITPYDATHLGHAFTFITYDVLVRYLRFLGKKVTYVQNVTDIDDDILNRAKKLKINWKKLGDLETEKYQKDMTALNMIKPDFFPKATDHIYEMIKIIKVLIKKELAYEKPQSVYFEIKKDRNFGKLSRLDYQTQLKTANERGNFPDDPNKKDPLDFVLWQASKNGEPFWNSPWGRGRPGWHIECSAMSMEYLGPTVTIHGGGEDLIFPHHEAEIAQSENFTGKKFVKIWMHTGMVYCDQKKMSKSLCNMVFVSDLFKKYTPNAIRIFLLSYHFRKSWNYEEQKLPRAQKFATELEKFKKAQTLSKKELQKATPVFFTAMDDNLDIPRVLAYVQKLIKSKNKKTSSIVKTCSEVIGLSFKS